MHSPLRFTERRRADRASTILRRPCIRFTPVDPVVLLFQVRQKCVSFLQKGEKEERNVSEENKM